MQQLHPINALPDASSASLAPRGIKGILDYCIAIVGGELLDTFPTFGMHLNASLTSFHTNPIDITTPRIQMLPGP